MNYPPTTPSSQRLMTSKPRFLGDGADEVCLYCYFRNLAAQLPLCRDR
jgi:hypothetical protein